MAKIISIETATKVCSVALHYDGKLIATQSYHIEKSHSSLLPLIIEEMMNNCEFKLSDMDAIAVSSGPGSYTGLRIGATTAKGLAYGLNKKLVGISTLEAMYHQIRKIIKTGYFCPMIDARRMEVYCELRNDCQQYWGITPLIVEQDSFSRFQDKPIYLFGDGASKTKQILKQENIIWLEDIHPSAVEIGELAEIEFQKENFEDVAYFEPLYLKDFHTTPAKKTNLMIF